MKHLLRLLLITLLNCSMLFSQESRSASSDTQEQIRVLTSTSRTNLEIPMFPSNGNSVCDASGDVVFNVGDSIFGRGPFLRIEADDRSHVVYSLPKEAPGSGNLTWAITPGGTFYVLANDFKVYKMYSFKTDGTLAGETKVEIPSATDILSLAVQDDGTALVVGFDANPTLKSKKRSGYAGIFSSSGQLVHDLSSIAPTFDPIASRVRPVSGGSTSGEDGRFYLLQQQKVLVISQTGTIEKQLKFHKLIEDAIPIRIDYSKGYLSIVLHLLQRPEHNKPPEVQVEAILMNAQTEEEQRNFSFDPSTTGNVICYTRADGYALMAVDGRMAAKDIVPIR